MLKKNNAKIYKKGSNDFYRNLNVSKKKIAIVSNTSWSVNNFRLGLIKKLQELLKACIARIFVGVMQAECIS